MGQSSGFVTVLFGCMGARVGERMPVVFRARLAVGMEGYAAFRGEFWGVEQIHALLNQLWRGRKREVLPGGLLA